MRLIETGDTITLESEIKLVEWLYASSLAAIALGSGLALAGTIIRGTLAPAALLAGIFLVALVMSAFMLLLPRITTEFDLTARCARVASRYVTGSKKQSLPSPPSWMRMPFCRTERLLH